MKVWREKYGQDADGNRGVMMTFTELEYTEQENEEIAEILYNKGYNSQDSGTFDIEYEDHDVSIEVSEYSEEIAKIEKDDGIFYATATADGAKDFINFEYKTVKGEILTFEVERTSYTKDWEIGQKIRIEVLETN